MKLTDQITVLELKGPMGTIYPTLIQNGERLLLIDTGFPGQFEMLGAAMEDDGYSFSQLTGIVITHQDIDHIGNLAEIRKANPGIKVYAHGTEAPYITGAKTPVKIAQVEAVLPSLPDEKKQFYEQFKAAFVGRQAEVDVLLANGDRLEQAPFVEVLFTPGHTPGHICLYDVNERILIAGDALHVLEGKKTEANTHYACDEALAVRSYEKLMNLNADRIVAYHGGII